MIKVVREYVFVSVYCCLLDATALYSLVSFQERRKTIVAELLGIAAIEFMISVVICWLMRDFTLSIRFLSSPYDGGNFIGGILFVIIPVILLSVKIGFLILKVTRF